MIKKIINIISTYLFNRIKRPGVKSVKVSRKASIESTAIIEENCFIDSESSIGKYTYIGSYTSVTRTKIGNYCSIASFVKIGHGEHDIRKISTSARFYNSGYEELTKKECNIGNDVWIGTDAIILRGVTIGDGAIIGANALVNKNIPDFAIAVGSPAKVIKFRFSENKRKRIKESKWWELNLTDAKHFMKSFENQR